MKQNYTEIPHTALLRFLKKTGHIIIYFQIKYYDSEFLNKFSLTVRNY